MRATTDATVNVLFATDGSKSAEQARELVASIDWPAPSHIEVLHVDQLFTEDLDVPADDYSAAHEKLRAELTSEIEGVKAACLARAAAKVIPGQIPLGVSGLM